VSATSWPGIIEAYREHLPVGPTTPIVTLLEGNTPLLPAPRVAQRAGVGEVFLKVEGLNPTGSFKDRGMTMAITAAVEAGAKLVICASTGNTSASAAAYAARAGVGCAVVLPEGNVALGKLAQALIHGARVLPIHGNFDDALRIVRELGTRPGIEVVNSVNPFRIEGQKTASFEIVEALGDAPTVHFLPVGNAGNITAYWRGYRQYHELGKATRLPRMSGWQAHGSAPIVLGEPVPHPETIATAIRIGNPASWQGAVDARDESDGTIGAVTDAQILDAYRMLASEEGCFVEPASAASVAGLFEAVSTGLVRDDDVVVCTVTGHGLKDPQRAINEVDVGASIAATTDAVAAALELDS
jgi:threonine synthase